MQYTFGIGISSNTPTPMTRSARHLYNLQQPNGELYCIFYYLLSNFYSGLDFPEMTGPRRVERDTFVFVYQKDKRQVQSTRYVHTHTHGMKAAAGCARRFF